MAAEPSNKQLGREVKTKVTVYAADYQTGLVISDVQFELQPLRRDPNSGGHDHDTDDRPLGNLFPLSGNTGPTANGFVVEYTSPEVSGKVFSDASCSNQYHTFSCFAGQYFSFTTKVPDLVNLDGNIYYDSVGATGEHSSNRWGSVSFLEKLKSAAYGYYPKYFGSTLAPKLAINDINLKWGGLFDIYGNWSPPHLEHRIGVVADIRTPPSTRATFLREALLVSGIIGPLLIHGPPAPHWHVREFPTNE